MSPEETKTQRNDKHIADDSSPITVGGGGGKHTHKDRLEGEPNVRCTFNDAHYPEAQGSPATGRKKYRHAGWKIKTFKVRSNGVWDDKSDLLNNNPNSKVVISCEGDDDDIIINNDSDFGIDMDPDTYLNVGSGVHRNPNAESFIFRVQAIAPGVILYDKNFDAEDECAVCTDHVKPDKSNCLS